MSDLKIKEEDKVNLECAIIELLRQVVKCGIMSADDIQKQLCGY